MAKNKIETEADIYERLLDNDDFKYFRKDLKRKYDNAVTNAMREDNVGGMKEYGNIKKSIGRMQGFKEILHLPQEKINRRDS